MCAQHVKLFVMTPACLLSLKHMLPSSPPGKLLLTSSETLITMWCVHVIFYNLLLFDFLTSTGSFFSTGKIRKMIKFVTMTLKFHCLVLFLVLPQWMMGNVVLSCNWMTDICHPRVVMSVYSLCIYLFVVHISHSTRWFRLAFFVLIRWMSCSLLYIRTVSVCTLITLNFVCMCKILVLTETPADLPRVAMESWWCFMKTMETLTTIVYHWCADANTHRCSYTSMHCLELERWRFLSHPSLCVPYRHELYFKLCRFALIFLSISVF